MLQFYILNTRVSFPKLKIHWGGFIAGSPPTVVFHKSLLRQGDGCWWRVGGAGAASPRPLP